MEIIDAGRPRRLLDLAITGRPLVDRNGMTWWLVGTPGERLFGCGETPQAAQRNKVPPVGWADLNQLCGPLRAGDRPRR